MSALQKVARVLVLILLAVISSVAADTADPWTASELVTPAQLNAQLADVKAGKMVLVQVGFRVMYQLAHIPGSQYAGPAAKAEGMDSLKKLVGRLPRNQKIVVYCGCCPWNDCPNIRPAVRALKDMGFTNFKILNVPERFGDDWTAKGYPVVKGD
jgi:thiosulfate/3-mercaptopyruvate sulfurtransferase